MVTKLAGDEASLLSPCTALDPDQELRGGGVGVLKHWCSDAVSNWSPKLASIVVLSVVETMLCMQKVPALMLGTSHFRGH